MQNDTRRLTEEGFTLIEILIAGAIMGILIMASTSLLTQQRNEIRSLSENLAKLNLETSLINTLADGSVCHYMLVTNPTNSGFATSPVIFDSTTLPAALSLSKIPLTAAATAPAIAQSGTNVSALSATVKIQSIEVDVLSPAGPPNTYNAQISVKYFGALRPLRPTQIKNIVLQTSGAGSNTTISGCGNASSSGNSGLIFDSGLATESGGVSSRTLFLPSGTWQVNVLSGLEMATFQAVTLTIDGADVYTSPGPNTDPSGTNWIPLIGSKNNVAGNRTITVSFNTEAPFGTVANIAVWAIKQ